MAETLSVAPATKAQLASLTPQDLEALGTNIVAYTRPVEADNEGEHQTFWAIFAANGQQIGWAPTYEMAQQAIRSHDMQPVRLH